MELSSCHPIGAQNFGVAPKFLENLYKSGGMFSVVCCILHIEYKFGCISTNCQFLFIDIVSLIMNIAAWM